MSTLLWSQLKQWLEVEYMSERIHSALNYLTLAEFETENFEPAALSL
jgi:hypothetical protein